MDLETPSSTDGPSHPAVALVVAAVILLVLVLVVVVVLVLVAVAFYGAIKQLMSNRLRAVNLLWK